MTEKQTHHHHHRVSAVGVARPDSGIGKWTPPRPPTHTALLAAAVCNASALVPITRTTKHALISAARNAKRRSSHAQKLAASGED